MKNLIILSSIIFSLIILFSSCSCVSDEDFNKKEVLKNGTTYFYFQDSENYLIIKYENASFEVLKSSASLKTASSFKTIDSTHVSIDGIVLNQIPSEFGGINYQEKLSVPSLRYVPESDILIGIKSDNKVYISKSNYLYETSLSSVQGKTASQNVTGVDGSYLEDSYLWYELYLPMEDENIYQNTSNETGRWLVKYLEEGGGEDVYSIKLVVNTTIKEEGGVNTELSYKGDLVGKAVILK